MADISYTISLRIMHPIMKCQDICRLLSMKPRVSSNVGEPRENPPGRLLGGVYGFTFCTFELIEKNAGFFTDGIVEVLSRLAAHRQLLQSISDTGGSSELYVGVFTDADTAGFTMGVEMMEALADLHLQLSTQFYCS